MMLIVNNENEKSINSYFKNESSFNYESDMIINVPKINLERVVKQADKDFSNLDKNLVYYKRNNPEEKIIIFGHSGVGYGTYFNRIDELKINDNVYLYIDKTKLTYIVDNIYNVFDDKIDILKNDENRVLLFVTCSKTNKNERLIVKLLQKNAQTLKK